MEKIWNLEMHPFAQHIYRSSLIYSLLTNYTNLRDSALRNLKSVRRMPILKRASSLGHSPDSVYCL